MTVGIIAAFENNFKCVLLSFGPRLWVDMAKFTILNYYIFFSYILVSKGINALGRELSNKTLVINCVRQ